MAILDRLAFDATRVGAVRLVAAYTLLTAILSALCNGALAAMFGEPLVREMLEGALMAFVVTPLALWPLAKAATALRQREAQFVRQAQTDSMTGVLNRRGFFAAGAGPIAPPSHTAPGAMPIDLEHFKPVNDTYGHAAGDAAVIAASAAIAQTAGPDCVVGRIGGDEFCVLAAGLSEFSAALLAERLRAAVEARMISHSDRTLRVTVSIGYAARRLEDGTLDAVLARADAALYGAKSLGRNCASAPLETQAARRRA